MKNLICLIAALIAFTNTASATRFDTTQVPMPGVFQLYAKNPSDSPCGTYLELTIGYAGVLGHVAKIEEKYRMSPNALCAFPAIYNPFVRVFEIYKDMNASDDFCGGHVYIGSGVEQWQNNINILDTRGMRCRKHFPNTIEAEITVDGETFTMYHNPSWL